MSLQKLKHNISLTITPKKYKYIGINKHRILMKIIKEYFKSEETHVFMNWKSQHHKDVNCPQTDL